MAEMSPKVMKEFTRNAALDMSDEEASSVLEAMMIEKNNAIIWRLMRMSEDGVVVETFKHWAKIVKASK